MASIVGFLEARIAEDESYAHHGLGLLGHENPWWTWSNLKLRFEGMSRADAQHIERHSPRRVMAECAAKRAVLALHPIRIYTDEEPGFSMELSTCLCQGRPCSTLQALAAVYDGHPDYQQEWSNRG